MDVINSNTATHTQSDCVLDVPGSGGKATRRTHPYCARGESELDARLLDRWRHERCTQAFQQLVARHTPWVCALARRRVKDRHLAEDVTQAVFLILSKKAGRIGPDTPLSAWLFRVTRFASNDAIKREARRRKRFERAASLYTERVESDESDPDIDVDECIACLGDTDRQVILLRFYEDKSMAQVGQALGISEHAAKKRVTRALSRLRRVFARRGIRVSSLLSLMGLLKQTVAADTASASTLATEVAHAAVGSAAPNAPIAALANATLRSLATAHARILAALAGASVVLCVAVTTLSPVMGQALAPLLQKVRTLFPIHVIPLIAPQISNSAAPKPEAITRTSEPIRQVWAGRTGEFAWPLLPGPAGSLSLQSVGVIPSSIAIIEDHRGQLWYRKVDPELIPPPAESIGPDSYQDLNPYTDTAYHQALLNQVAQDLQMFGNTTSADESWRPLDQLRIDKGSILPDDLYIQYAETSPAADGSMPIHVPEPGLAGIAVGVCLLVCLRRR